MTKKLPLQLIAMFALSVTILSGCGTTTTISTTSTGTVETGTMTDTGMVMTGEVATGDTTSTGTTTDTGVVVATGTATTGDTSTGTSKTVTSKKTSYKVPSNQEANITVIAKVNTADQTIEEMTIQNESNDPKTAEYQKNFISKIGAAVVGKKLDDAHVSQFNGSSLTSVAFNQAIDDIKAQL